MTRRRAQRMTISRSCSLQKWAANNHRVSWQGLHPHSQTSLHATMVNVRIDRLSRPGVELPPAQHAAVRRRQQAKAGGRRAPELFVRWLRALECLDAAVLVVVGELAVAGVPHDQVRGARARHAGWQPQAAPRAGGLGRASLRLVDPGVVLCRRRALSGRHLGDGAGEEGVAPRRPGRARVPRLHARRPAALPAAVRGRRPPPTPPPAAPPAAPRHSRGRPCRAPPPDGGPRCSAGTRRS